MFHIFQRGVFGTQLVYFAEERFGIWVSALHKISDALQLDLHLHPSKFRQKCQHILPSFIKVPTPDIADTSKHPIFRTYRYIKSSFRTQPHINMVKDSRYRCDISQLRCSSHILNVERGRYTRSRTPLEERLCNMNNCLGDELHFVTACAINLNEGRILYDKVMGKIPEFENVCDVEKLYSCVLLMMLKSCPGLVISYIHTSAPKPPKCSPCWPCVINASCDKLRTLCLIADVSVTLHLLVGVSM